MRKKIPALHLNGEDKTTSEAAKKKIMTKLMGVFDTPHRRSSRIELPPSKPGHFLYKRKQHTSTIDTLRSKCFARENEAPISPLLQKEQPNFKVSLSDVTKLSLAPEIRHTTCCPLQIAPHTWSGVESILTHWSFQKHLRKRMLGNLLRLYRSTSRTPFSIPKTKKSPPPPPPPPPPNEIFSRCGKWRISHDKRISEKAPNPVRVIRENDSIWLAEAAGVKSRWKRNTTRNALTMTSP